LPRVLRRNWNPALKREDQVFGVKFQFLQTHFLELFVCAEIGLLNQFFQPLSVAVMFGMQAIDFFAQRVVLYLIHQAPPVSATLIADEAGTPIVTEH
jgi:hypothetical protein